MKLSLDLNNVKEIIKINLNTQAETQGDYDNVESEEEEEGEEEEDHAPSPNHGPAPNLPLPVNGPK